MDSRRTMALASAVFVLAVGGSFISFAATNSQAQFAALNAVFLYSAAFVALAGVCFIPSQGVPRRATAGSVAVLTFVAWAILSSVLSGRLMSAVLGEPTSLMGLGALTAAAVIAFFAWRNPAVAHPVMMVGMPLLLLTQAAWAMSQAPTIVDAGRGGFGNSSALGLALVLAVPWVLAMAGEDPWARSGAARRHQTARRAGAALLAVFAAGVALRTESRSSALLIAATCAWYVIARSHLSARVKRITVVAFTVLGAAGVGIMVAAERAAKLPFGFLTIRYVLWSTALRAFSARPVLGWGADGFFSGGASVTGAGGSLVSVPLVFADGTTDPHNLVVFAAVCFGVVGLAASLVLAVLLGHHMVTRRRSLERFDPAAVALVGGFTSLLITPLTLELLPLFALTLGLCLGIPQRSAAPDGASAVAVRREAPVLVRWSVCAVLGVALVALTVDAIGVVRLGPVGYFQPASYSAASRVAASLPLDPYLSYHANAAFAQVSTPDQIEAAKGPWEHSDPIRAMKLDSRNPYYALGYAQALWNAGGPTADVVAAYEGAIARYPSFPAAHADLALLYATSGEWEQANVELAQVRLSGNWSGYPWGSTADAAQRAIEAGSR